jgi:uncharacterized protein
MMESVEQAARAQTEAKAKVQELEGRLAARQNEIASRKKVITDEIARQQAQRAEAMAALSPVHRELYERLRQKADGKAVVGARRGACEGCFMDLTSNTINQLMGGDELIRCHSCGRILYLVADDPDDGEDEE